MPSYKLMTGNLSQQVAATAIPYKVKKDFPKDLKPEDGFRFSFVGYKVSKKQKTDPNFATMTLPKSFAVQLPVVSVADIIAAKQGEDFVRSIFLDYQDTKTHDAADKESDVDPTDINALIADYFSTERSGIKAAEIKQWCLEVFAPAFFARKKQTNDTLNVGNAGKINETMIGQLADTYAGYVQKIVTGKSALPLNVVTSTKTWLEKLAEVGLIDSEDDEIFQHVLRKTTELVQSATMVTEDAV